MFFTVAVIKASEPSTVMLILSTVKSDFSRFIVPALYVQVLSERSVSSVLGYGPSAVKVISCELPSSGTKLIVTIFDSPGAKEETSSLAAHFPFMRAVSGNSPV